MTDSVEDIKGSIKRCRANLAATHSDAGVLAFATRDCLPHVYVLAIVAQPSKLPLDDVSLFCSEWLRCVWLLLTQTESSSPCLGMRSLPLMGTSSQSPQHDLMIHHESGDAHFPFVGLFLLGSRVSDSALTVGQRAA